MKKKIIGVLISGSLSCYASNSYHIIVSPLDNKYDIKTFYRTGKIQCNSISPLESEIYKDIAFKEINSDCKAEEKHSHDETTRWVDIPDFENNKVGTLLLSNCSQILNGGHGDENGVYKALVNDLEIDILCDMNTNGGGWTLVSYSGSIQTDKKTTTGENEDYYQPLIFNYGEMDVNSPSNKKTFSRFDLFKDDAKNTDEILFKRSSNSKNMIIFPIQNLSFFGRSDSEGQFQINSSNRNLPYLKMTNNGNSSWKTVTNNVKWNYLDRLSSHYPGISWNTTEGLNCDNCGLSYDTGLSHRSIIYWETNDLKSDYSHSQWFHAEPLSLTDSTSPSNLYQDLEFWYREK